MAGTIHSPRHRLLVEMIRNEREKSGKTQTRVAQSLRRHQSYVANIETGQRRLDVVEFIDLANAVGFDPVTMLQQLVSSVANSKKTRRQSSPKTI